MYWTLSQPFYYFNIPTHYRWGKSTFNPTPPPKKNILPSQSAAPWEIARLFFSRFIKQRPFRHIRSKYSKDKGCEVAGPSEKDNWKPPPPPTPSENLTFGVLGGVWIVYGNGRQLISCYFKIVAPQPINNKVVLTCVTSPTYLQPLSLCHDVTCTLHSPSLVWELRTDASCAGK